MPERPSNISQSKVCVTFIAGAEAMGDEASRRRMEVSERLFASMCQGPNFGGEAFDRAEIYEQRIMDLEARRA
jgi:hypothetical protein